MADSKPTAQQTEPVSLTGKRFVDMTGSEKITFIGKAIIMLCTGGFAFPNVFVE